MANRTIRPRATPSPGTDPAVMALRRAATSSRATTGYQPGYPVAEPTQRKSRLGTWLSLLAIAVVLAIAGVVLFVTPGLLVTKYLSHSAVERFIQSDPATGFTNVKCNDSKDVKLKKGTTFTCTADGGKKATVTITSGSGDYTWSPG